ncbi:hypothetical protein [Thiolapillus sp.]|uniref:hypothetical protein n=1 Tax=Thiolapillus sp. TaxID=2017437 RepID=UPI003AF5F610
MSGGNHGKSQGKNPPKIQTLSLAVCFHFIYTQRLANIKHSKSQLIPIKITPLGGGLTAPRALLKPAAKSATQKFTKNTKALFSSLLSLHFNSDGYKHQAHQVSAHSNPNYSFGGWRDCALQSSWSKKRQEKSHPKYKFILCFTFLASSTFQQVSASVPREKAGKKCKRTSFSS